MLTTPTEMVMRLYKAVYLNDYATPREARLALNRYFQFYNHERVHQSLKYRTPADV